MSRIASIVSNDGTITLMLDGSPYTIGTEHPNYLSIKESLRDSDADTLLTLVDIPKSVKAFANGVCEVRDGVIYYEGNPLHNNLTNRILTLMNEGFPFEPMLRFLENLMSNPSARAVNELYDFLEHKNLPITEDGCFLAYKGTRSDGKDKYSGKIDNSVGRVVEIPRNQVDDDRAHECSFGLHVGTMGYVRWYCTERVIVVKVNPKDCVSVPRDHNAQKLRVCRYEVLGLYEGDLDAPVYNSDGSTWEPNEDEEMDEELYIDDDLEDEYYFGHVGIPDDEEDDYTYDDSEEEEEDYGVKPSGHRYWQHRDSTGKFSPKK